MSGISNPAGRQFVRIFTILAVTGLAACSEQTQPVGPEEETDVPALLEETRTQPAPTLSRIQNSPAVVAGCGATASYRLWAGVHFPGTIRVANDAENLYVTYAIDEGKEEWFISDTRVSVSTSLLDIPLDHRRLPNPWAFEYGAVHGPPTKSYTYSIPLKDHGLTAGKKVVVAAMAGVVHPKTSDWSGEWEWLVGWGIGNVSGRSLDDIANYEVQGCPDMSPPPAPGSNAAITITFDDGWESTYTRAFPILQEYGLKGNVAVNPVPIDELWTGYMRIEHLRALHDAGWAIVAHGMTHKALPEMTDAELQYEVSETKQWIQSHGFRGSEVFIVPFHRWGEREAAVIKQHYTAARGYTANQFWPVQMVPFPISGEDAYELTGFEPEFAPFTTAKGRAVTKEYLERAVANGEFVDIFFHKIEEQDVGAFRELVKVLAEYKQYVRSYDQIPS